MRQLRQSRLAEKREVRHGLASGGRPPWRSVRKLRGDLGYLALIVKTGGLAKGLADKLLDQGVFWLFLKGIFVIP